jgi:hypothetical protein
MPEHEKAKLAAELEDHESERRRLTRELRGRKATDPEGIYMSAQILRHRIALALLRSRLNFEES